VDPSQFQDGWTRDFAADGEYGWDEGVLMVPTAGPVGSPAEAVRTHAPTATRRWAWTVESVNGPPSAPDWRTNNPNEIVLRRAVGTATPLMSPDGSWFWRLRGVYVYGLLYPPQPENGDSLAQGGVPFATDSAASFNVGPGQWDQTLSDSSSTIPAGFVPPVP
jgi:hypothetical protein